MDEKLVPLKVFDESFLCAVENGDIEIEIEEFNHFRVGSNEAKLQSYQVAHDQQELLHKIKWKYIQAAEIDVK